ADPTALPDSHRRSRPRRPTAPPGRRRRRRPPSLRPPEDPQPAILCLVLYRGRARWWSRRPSWLSFFLIHGSVLSWGRWSDSTPVKLWPPGQRLRLFGRAPGRGARLVGLLFRAAVGLFASVFAVGVSAASPSDSSAPPVSSEPVDEPLPLAGTVLGGRFG